MSRSRPTTAPDYKPSDPDSGLPSVPPATSLDFPAEVLTRKNPFGEFIREIRRSEDSLHYHLGELAFKRQRYDSALSHHLAADVPASGAFREALLTQRSGIFARLWPGAAPRAEGKDRLPVEAQSETGKPVFEWGMGTSHSRGLFRTGVWQPDGWWGMADENRYWMYRTYARQSWPLSVHGQALNLAASVNQSAAGEFSTLDAALEAQIPDGILENLALVLSGGNKKSRDWGSYQAYGLLLSKAWYFESTGMGLQAGFSREWDQAGMWLSDNSWIAMRRDIQFENGNTFGLSLDGAIDNRAPQSEWITTSVLYVDDVTKAQPTHYRTQDFRDTLHTHAGDAFQQYAQNAGALQLAMVAPQAYFSLSPALQFGAPIAAGFEAMVRARYALDIYPESGWDWVPTTDSMHLSNSDLMGLAYNRADGRYYAAALAEEIGGVREIYGTEPLQHRKAKRLDQRVGLEFSTWRALPHGYTLALEASGELGWSSLTGTSPIGSQPWQWSLTFNLSRSSVW